ncbi:GNAT family N-acetyltransferase [Nocardioides sp. GCM10027113]|uniref:GNAT family N-acetyltransferase n=1 Tax=unclassified Nocardioides TaxID=2615069 RepID=UPI00360650FC
MDSADVVEVGQDRYQELIALALERNPTMTESDIGWQLYVRESWPDLVTMAAVDDGGHVRGWGWMASGAHNPPGWTSLWVTVRADSEGQGLGGSLHRALLERRPPGAVMLRSGVVDSEPRSLEVARGWGFEVEELSITSALELRDLPEPSPPAGVALEACPDLRFPDQPVVEEMVRVSQTNPEALAGQLLDCGQLRSAIQGADAAVAVLARVDGAPAGIVTGVVVDGLFFVGYTGVDPRFRGRGLARLLKERAHLDAAAAGARTSRTDNEENNHGIRRVNRELGYEVSYGTFRLRKPLRQPSASPAG